MEALPLDILRDIILFLKWDVIHGGVYLSCLRRTCKLWETVISPSKVCINNVVSLSNSNLLGYFIESGATYNQYTLDAFVKRNLARYAIQLCELGVPISKYTLINASKHCAEMLKYIHKRGATTPDILHELYVTAAKHGNLEVLVYLCPFISNAENEFAMARAFDYGNYASLKFLCENEHPISGTTKRVRCHEGVTTDEDMLKCIEYLQTKGIEWHHTLKDLTQLGFEKCARYSYPFLNHSKSDNSLCWYSTFYGKPSLLKFFHGECGVPLDVDLYFACEIGNLEIITYLHENGVAWEEDTCSILACISFECLRYAYEHGAPWNGTTENQDGFYMVSNGSCRSYVRKDNYNIIGGVGPSYTVGILPEAVEYAKELGLI